MENRNLGKFDSPAPRVVPQIKVTFRVDADSVLRMPAEIKVTALSNIYKWNGMVLSAFRQIYHAFYDR